MIRRVRTGCITCRKRRIKCDERKPTCERCGTANFACEGYDTARRTSHPSRKSRSPNRHDAVPIVGAEMPWRNSNWRQEQLPLYHHFVTSSVYRLFRIDHVGFWRDQVAQMSFGVDAVYEALLAVGAAHRASLLSCSNKNVQEVTRCKVLGLSSYGKALRLLAAHMDQNVMTDYWTILVVLLLCTYFECFMENSKAALRHLWAAIQVLRESEDQLSAVDKHNIVPVYEVILHFDFLALKLFPYATSSFSRCSNIALQELPFWSRTPDEFSLTNQSDSIATERHRLVQLICGHNKLSRVIWGCWYPKDERPTRDELMGFYNEMVLWKSTSPTTLSSFPEIDSNHASNRAEFEALPIPPIPLKVNSSAAAINVIMFNGYMGCALAMMSTTDEDPIPREIEAYNLAYQNLRLTAGLIFKENGRSPTNYTPCDTLGMGISIFLYHGARRCFLLKWQQWTILALHTIGREGLSNAHALANTLEIMISMETSASISLGNGNRIAISPLGLVRDRLIPLLMPRGDEPYRYLVYLLRYGATEEDGDDRVIRIVGKATWTQDDSGIMKDLEVENYDSTDVRALSLPNDSGVANMFSSWRQSVERGWHGFLS